MALYSLKKISLLAESRQAYLRGVSGYNAGWVRAFAEEADAYYSRRITARVEESGTTYAVEVGIPTKSGVGGGLLAVSDKRAGIGVFGPALDAKGNSIAGCRLLKEISEKLRLALFYDTDTLGAARKEYSLNRFPKHHGILGGK